MDVDRDNFDDALVALEEHLPRASFVALDLEMTGIIGPPETSVLNGDVPQVQYAKGRSVVNKPFNVVQVGICLFEEGTPGAFECRPFNVFVFPRPVDERGPDGKQIRADPFLGLSSSSTCFLADNGMDFQRWVTKGVSYTSVDVEEALLHALPAEEGAQPSSSSHRNDKEKVEPSRPEDIQLVKDTMQKVSSFVDSGGEEMRLPNTNAYLALVLRQKIAERHPQLVVEKRPSPTNPNFQERWVCNLSDEGRKQKTAEHRRRLLALIGFRRMWRLLKAAQKPVVFHNGFFDLLFTMAAFDKPLPPALEDFKSLVHKAFPSAYDTKVLAESAELSGRLCSRSALPELAKGLEKRLRPSGVGGGTGEAVVTTDPYTDDVTMDCATGEASPTAVGPEAALISIGESGEEVANLSFSLPEGFRKYAGASGFHEAGYDAYETGRIFAYFRAVLGSQRIETFANRVFLMWSAFQLQLDRRSDSLAIEGIVRYLYQVDAKVLGNRGLIELLKPLTQDGKRRCAFRWCGPDKLLLVLHGNADTKLGAEGREACEQCLDTLLQREADMGRLRVSSLEAHLEAMAAVAAAAGEGSGGADEPPRKRQRQE